MVMRFLTRPTSVAASILAAGTAIVAVACQTDSHPTAPSVQATSSVAAGSQVKPDGGVAQGPAPKLDICHALGNGNFQLINISANAESSHRAHGDAQPGELIPGSNPSLRLDTACRPMPAAPAPLLACPCWDTYSEQQLVSALNAPIIQEKFCAATPDTVIAVANNGAEILFASSTTNSCRLTLNGQDKMLSGLQPEVGSQCLLEAKTLFPRISWCQ